MKPLAERMRPTRLSEVIGQQHVVGPSSPLRNALDQGKMYSMVLYGPPGTGKTTIAQAIANEFKADFIKLSAVTAGIKDLREVIKKAETNQEQDIATVLFIDEIHRWNKSQQDALLPHIESGLVKLIGATTESPGHEINRALMSRLKLEVLESLSREDMRTLIDSALGDKQRGLGRDDNPYSISKQTEDFLFNQTSGDARSLLNNLERISLEQPDGGDVSVETAAKALGRKVFAFDKNGSMHYDLVSAFIKSIRGSDTTAALYYLARLERGGADPKFVARRLVVLASEDVGMGRPGALAVAVSGFQAVEIIGAPECWINIAHITAYLASCPKNWDSYKGLRKAQDLVDRHPQYEVPVHLKNASDPTSKALGFGKGYVHASAPGATTEFLPAELRGLKL